MLDRELDAGRAANPFASRDRVDEEWFDFISTGKGQ